jgi:hypothetical protein
MSAPNAHAHDSARFGPGAIIRRSAGGSSDTVRRLYGSSHSDVDTDQGLDSLLSGQLLDELVERVADKLQERVIEELERRGRRSLPEVF